MALVLVSHSSLDKDAAREAALFLVIDDVGVWYDEWDIPHGESIIGGIEDALAQASHVVLMWSRPARESPWVTAERQAALALALKRGSPQIIVVRLDDEEPPPLLSDRRFMTWRGGTEEDRVELVDAVLGRGPSAAFIRAVVRKYNEVI